MKHGISPTTNRQELKRRGKYIHVSKPLAIAVYKNTGEFVENVPFQLDYFAPPNHVWQTVMAPVKGSTAKRDPAAPVAKGRGKRRRAAKKAGAQK